MGEIVVIDYGMGNLHSVAKAVERVAGAQRVRVTHDVDIIAAADRVVFPGVGAMPDCLRELDARGLRQSIVDAASSKPFLGICLGMQALFQHSEEGAVDGLGLLPGRVERFPRKGMFDAEGLALKVPHIGWNQVMPPRPHPLWAGIEPGTRFYFVHSYFCRPEDDALLAGVTHYPFAFASAVARGNLFAVQFHPEKSQAAGLRLLANFVAWDGHV